MIAKLPVKLSVTKCLIVHGVKSRCRVQPRELQDGSIYVGTYALSAPGGQDAYEKARQQTTIQLVGNQSVVVMSRNSNGANQFST